MDMGRIVSAVDRDEPRSGALALLSRSRLSPLELGFGPRLLLRRLTLRLGARLTARWRSLAARLGARWRGLSAPPFFRGRAALRFRRPRRRCGPVEPIGPVVALGAGLVPVIGLIRPVAMIALVGPVTPVWTGLVGVIGLVGPTAVSAIVIPLVF